MWAQWRPLWAALLAASALLALGSISHRDFGPLATSNSGLLHELNDVAAAAILNGQQLTSNGPAAPQSSTACAMVFFGQLKNLEPQHMVNLTGGILNSLRARCGRIEAFLHTYAMASTNNPRNNEIAAPLNLVGSFKLLLRTLHANDVHLAGAAFSTKEQALSAHRNVDYYLQRGDPWPESPKVTLTHFLLQMYSLDRASELWWPFRNQYAMVLYLRPDLVYTSALPIPDPIRKNTLYAPEFDRWWGINDRELKLVSLMLISLVSISELLVPSLQAWDWERQRSWKSTGIACVSSKNISVWCRTRIQPAKLDCCTPKSF